MNFRVLNANVFVTATLLLIAEFAQAQEYGVVTRFNRTNGSPDTSLNGTGRIVQTTAQGYDTSVAVDANGKIIVGENLIGGGLLIGRYNSNGTPDSTFGYGGVTSVDSAHNSEVHGVGVDSSGRVYALVDGTNGGTLTGAYVVRFATNGAVDTTYKNASSTTPGYVLAVNASLLGTDLDVAPDGSAAVVVDAYPHGFDVAKVDPTGFVQYSKGFFFESSSGSEHGNGVKIDASGNVVVVGESATGKMGVMRYAGGNPDPSFNSGRPVLQSFGYSEQRAVDVTVDGLGQIVTVGYTPTNQTVQVHFLLLRLNSSGAFDAQGDFTRGSTISATSGWTQWSIASYGSYYYVGGAMLVSSSVVQDSLFKLNRSDLSFVSGFAHTGWMDDGIPGYNNSAFWNVTIDPVTTNPVLVGVALNR
ncbi:MAG TPA: hypothetical protein VHC69_01055 [Polyangiaceae bacterium]|nr:hypothetical protein [Polyangiaceae bacterium]